MNFLFAHNNADLYGASRSLLRLTSRLVEDGSRVSVILPYRGALSDALKSVGVQCVFIPGLAVVERSAFRSFSGIVSFCFRLPVSVFRICSLIQNTKPDLVHSNTSVMLPSALAAKLCRVPHVWHIREFYSDFPSFWKVYQRIMAFCSSRIVCVSTPVQLQFAVGTRRKTAVIHNGFPADEFTAVEPERVEAFRSRYGLTAQKLIGVVGRLKLKRKGQEVFIAAAGKLVEKHSDAQFVLIGSVFPGNEEHEAELRRLAAPLGDHVVFTGDVDDIKAAYATLDLVVMPSGMPEPFGGVVIEAMAMGKPVIGTNIGGTPEQIQNEETGLLFAPDDMAALSGHIERLLSDAAEAERFGQAGRLRFEEKFEFAGFYRQIQELYQQVMGERD